MSEHLDAIIVLGHAGVNEQGQHDHETSQRIDTAIHLLNAGYSQNLVMSGCRSFLTTPTSRPLAEAMVETAAMRGVAPEALTAESISLETIGNGVFTKQEVLEPRGWHSVGLVTSPSHLARSTGIFQTVLGPDYEISPFASDPAERRAQYVYELLGKCLERGILFRIQPGDDLTVRQRLEAWIPGYSATSVPDRILRHIRPAKS